MTKPDPKKSHYTLTELLGGINAAKWSATHKAGDYIVTEGDSTLDVLTPYILDTMIDLAQLMVARWGLKRLLEDDGAVTDGDGEPIPPALWRNAKKALAKADAAIDRYCREYYDALISPMPDDNNTDFEELLVALGTGFDDDFELVDYASLPKRPQV